MISLTSSMPLQRTAFSLGLAAAMVIFTGSSAVVHAAGSGAEIDPAMHYALQQDLGLGANQIDQRLAYEREAGETEAGLRALLGDRVAGAWLADDERSGVQLVVAVTDEDAAEIVRAAGAMPRIAKHSNDRLEAIRTHIEQVAARHAGAQSPFVSYIDLENNQVVIEVGTSDVAAVRGTVSRSGVDASAVRVAAYEHPPELFNNVRGGDIYFNQTRGWSCSIGFSVRQGSQNGFATAGHCGSVNDQVSGFNNVYMGSFAASTYPGADHAWVRITNNIWALQPWVNNYSGSNVQVVGEQEASLGASICRSGATTGYRCGTIGAKGVSVNYGQGIVSGLWRISACAGRGDSGGSVITPAGHAQGVTSGGQLPGGSNNNCGVNPPVTYIQPWLPIRNAYNLTLFTGSAGGSPPTITMFLCPDHGNSGSNTYACRVSYNSATPAQVQWSSSGGGVTSGDWHFGQCSQWQQVFAQVTVSNSFGSDTRSASFPCPDWIIP